MIYKYLTIDVDFHSYHMVMAKIYMGLRQSIQEELKSINKRQPAFLANIIHVSRGVVHGRYTLAPLFLGNSPPLHCHFYHTEDTQVFLHINNSLNHEE